jgi:hypothetical protein
VKSGEGEGGGRVSCGRKVLRKSDSGSLVACDCRLSSSSIEWSCRYLLWIRMTVEDESVNDENRVARGGTGSKDESVPSK